MQTITVVPGAPSEGRERMVLGHDCLRRVLEAPPGPDDVKVVIDFGGAV